MHQGKQHYKVLGIIRGVFVYAYFKNFLARLARQSLYMVKYTIPIEKYIAILPIHKMYVRHTISVFFYETISR